MLLRGGLLLSIAAVLLQIAVFLQPLLPKQYQIAPVCETITRALLQSATPQISTQASTVHSAHHQLHQDHQHQQHAEHDHHDANHQCQYCTVYGNLVLDDSSLALL